MDASPRYPLAMPVSRRVHYALHALLELARHSSERPLPIAAVARARRVPQHFLELILNQLRKAGLTESTRGKVGGHRLARDPARISVGEVLRAVEGGDPPRRARRAGGDVVEELWLRSAAASAELLEATSLAQLRDRELAAGDDGGEYAI